MPMEQQVMLAANKFEPLHDNFVTLPERASKVTLKRFLSQEEQVQLTNILVQLVAIDPVFPMLPNNNVFKELLTDLDQDVVNWLLSSEYKNVKSIAQQIADHNQTLIHKLTGI